MKKQKQGDITCNFCRRKGEFNCKHVQLKIPNVEKINRSFNLENVPEEEKDATKKYLGALLEELNKY